MSNDVDFDDIGREEEQWTLVQQAQYERTDRHDLTTTIIGAVADVEGVSPTELKDPVLYDCVDVAALEDAFFGPNVAGESRHGTGTVEFIFGKYRATVNSNGWVSVYE